MTIGKALAVIAGCAIVCGAAGITLGYAIGRWWPDAYRVWASPDMKFDPIQVGLGLGLAQGLGLGVVIGIAVTVIVAWYDVRAGDRRSR